MTAPDIDWGYVERLVRMACRHLPAHVDRDDIGQEANIAAWRAAGRFDATFGVPFEVFLAIRVRGAVRDVIRTNLPTVTRSGAPRPKMVSLNEPLRNGSGTEHGELADTVAWEDDGTAVLDLRDAVTEALARLDSRTRILLEEYLLHGRTMRDVGIDLGLSEAGVSLALTRACTRLRRIPSWQQIAAA